MLVRVDGVMIWIEEQVENKKIKEKAWLLNWEFDSLKNVNAFKTI